MHPLAVTILEQFHGINKLVIRVNLLNARALPYPARVMGLLPQKPRLHAACKLHAADWIHKYNLLNALTFKFAVYGLMLKDFAVILEPAHHCLPFFLGHSY